MFKRNAVIKSTGAYLPKRKLPNSYFNDLLGEDVDTWLSENLEIYERRWCDKDESTADLCENAGKIALERAGINASELNLIIVATDTPEYLSPSTASVVQFRLQAGHAGTFDLNSACAGFTTALDVGAKYIRTDENYKYVLVIGAYAMSKYLDMSNKKTVTLFSDGAGAVLLEAKTNTARGYLASELLTFGQYYDGMGIYGGGTKHPTTKESFENKDHLLKLYYRFPPELNPQMWTRMARNLCNRLEITLEDVNQLFLTQVNINSIRKTLTNLALPYDRAHTSMHYYGYAGSASIPLAFDDAIQKGKIKENDIIFFIGSGGGLTFGSVAMRF